MSQPCPSDDASANESSVNRKDFFFPPTVSCARRREVKFHANEELNCRENNNYFGAQKSSETTKKRLTMHA